MSKWQNQQYVRLDTDSKDKCYVKGLINGYRYVYRTIAARIEADKSMCENQHEADLLDYILDQIRDVPEVPMEVLNTIYAGPDE